MKPTLNAQTIAEVLDDFINNYGMFNEFEKFIKDKGYKLEEFGMTED